MARRAKRTISSVPVSYTHLDVYKRQTWHRIELLAVCYPLSWLLAATVFAIVYFRGGWLRRRIAQCGMEPEVKA